MSDVVITPPPPSVAESRVEAGLTLRGAKGF
jgi:hypothetical protein